MRKNILLLAFTFFACLLSAQPELSETAAQHQNQAASLLLNGEPAAAIPLLQAAAAQYRQGAEWEQYFSCLNQVTTAYLELGQLEDAKRMAKKALWESIEKLGRDNNAAARAAHKLGEAYSSAGRHDSALESHRLALMIRRKLFGAQHPELANSYDWIARAYAAMEVYDEAESYFQQARALRESVLGAEHAEVSDSYFLLGELASSRRQFEEALKLHRKALAIRRKSLGPRHPDVVQSLLRLGALYARLGAEKSAAQRYGEALAIWKKGSPVRREYMAEAFHFLAAAALEKGQVEEAAQLARQASGMPAGSGLSPAGAYMLGSAFLLNGAPEEAAHYLEEALRQEGQPAPAACFHQLVESHLAAGQARAAVARAEEYLAFAGRKEAGALALADANLLLGKSLLRLGAYEQAAGYLREGLAEEQSPPAWQQAGYIALAEAWLALGEEEEAIAALHQASAAGQQQGASAFHQMVGLQAMARAHSTLAAQDRHALDNLEAALRSAEAADRLLAELLRQPLSSGQLVLIRERQSEWYESALRICFSLNIQNPSPEYRQRAFHFAERSKQLDIALPLLLTGDIAFHGVPPALLQEEEICRRQIPRLARRGELAVLEGAAIEKEQPAPGDWHKRYEALLQNLQREAPAYYQMKYGLLAPDISGLHGLLHRQNTLLYGYYAGQEHLYVFFADDKELLLFRHTADEELSEQLARFAGFHAKGFPSEAEEAQPAGFAGTGEFLFSKLFPLLPSPAGEGGPPQLCILPHGPLALFPFESLPTDKTGGENFSTLPYLGRQYVITYNYTANALLEADYEQSIAHPFPFRAFVFRNGATRPAPPDSHPAGKAGEASDRLRFFSALAALWAEARDGEIWEGGQSGEASFRRMPKNGALLMATPTILAASPLETYLALSASPDSLYDNILDVKELYEMKTEAGLVFLSPPEAPSGGLSLDAAWPQLVQAWAYSGSNSLVLQRWNSPAPAPSESLLPFFLKAYLPGASIPSALLAARTAYLQESSPEKAHPHYWAAYMQVGAPRPIREKLPIPPYLIAVAVGALILIGWWARR